MFAPGEMNERIEILRESRSDDGAGGQTITLQTVATLWAHVRPRTGRELERFDRLNATGVYLFVIRYRQDIEEADRIRWKGEFYNIRFIRFGSARGLYLEIDAERGVAQ